jgi:L-fuculose-phosphate aldolase
MSRPPTRPPRGGAEVAAPAENRLRQEMAALSRRVWERGWVANHDGNLSVRLRQGRLLCTPTGVSKADVTAESLLVVDESGRVLQGSLRPFSELNLHIAALQARPDALAVLHAHPRAATALGAAGLALDRPFLPEAVVSLGPVIPTVPFALPGSEAIAALAPLLDEHDAFLLSGNGALTLGADLEQAYLRMELVEHLAAIFIAAQPLGGVRPLAPHHLSPLLAARKRAGLGPEARGRATTLPASAAEGPSPSELAEIVRDEIKKALK